MYPCQYQNILPVHTRAMPRTCSNQHTHSGVTISAGLSLFCPSSHLNRGQYVTSVPVAFSTECTSSWRLRGHKCTGEVSSLHGPPRPPTCASANRICPAGITRPRHAIIPSRFLAADITADGCRSMCMGKYHEVGFRTISASEQCFQDKNVG